MLKNKLSAFFICLVIAIAIFIALISSLEVYCRLKHPMAVIKLLEGRNKEGLRGPVVNVDKTPGVRRIMVFGGSTVYGWMVEYKDSFPYKLQELLNEDYGVEKYEVINAGKRSADSFAVLDEVKRDIRFNPDIVILYMGGNDIPYVIEENGKVLVAKEQTAPSRKGILGRPISMVQKYFYTHLVFPTVLREKLFLLKYGNVEEGYRRTLKFIPLEDEKEFHEFLTTKVENLKSNMDRIIKLVGGRSLVIIVVPPRPMMENLDTIEAKYFQISYEKICEAIESFKDRYKNVYVTSFKYIFPTLKTQKECHFDRDHLNANGNLVVAENLAKVIKTIRR